MRNHSIIITMGRRHTLVGTISTRLMELVLQVLTSARKSIHSLEQQMDYLIEYSGIYKFLHKHNPQTAQNIRAE